MKVLTIGTLGVVMGVACLGCSKNEEPARSAEWESDMQPASRSESGTAEPSQQAIPEADPHEGMLQPATSVPQAIVESRCATEERCQNVGAGRKYESIESCLIQVNEEWNDEMAERACAGGTERLALERCVGEIRAEACGDLSSDLDDFRACSVEELCQATTQ